MEVVRAIVRYRGRIAVAWLAAAALLLPIAGRVEHALDVSARILGSESGSVEQALRARFASPFARNALVVVTGVPAPDTAVGREALRAVVAALKVPGVTRTFSYLDRPDPNFLGSGGTFVVVGLDPGAGRVDQLVPSLRGATEAAAAKLRLTLPDVAVRWTGEAAINYDLWRTSMDAARTSEQRTVPLTLVLLLAAFGTGVAALLPLAAGALAVVLSLGAAGLIGDRWPLSILIVNVVSMLGLALGIDYALLAVSRFRESLAAGRAAVEAAAEAARYAGGTAALSGAAVAIGFLGMLLVPLNELRSAAVGGFLVAATSVLLTGTLVPGILAWLGHRVDSGPRLRRKRGPAARDRWREWAHRIVSHPWMVLALALPPVLLLAAQAPRLSVRIPRGDWLPQGMESARAMGDLRRLGRRGVVQALRVVLELPQDAPALSAAGWEAVRRLGEGLARDPRVAHVESLREPAGDQADDLAFVALLPTPAKRTFLSEEGDAALVEVVPGEDVDPAELTRFVRELRTADPAMLTGLKGCRIRVGGLPAFNADYEDAVAGRLSAIVGLVVAGTFLALAVGFRSALLPLKALALNLLAVAAAFGAVVLVFQDGFGVRLLGLAAPLDGVFPIVPVLVFCTLFGLSMDYEVFLVARVAEARRAKRGEAEALAEGLARTGPVITSAAAIMIAVFASFTLGDFVLIKMLGFALAVAVFLDATLIRIAIGPALLRLAGRWNWWPGERSPSPPGKGSFPTVAAPESALAHPGRGRLRVETAEAGPVGPAGRGRRDCGS